MGSLRWHAEDPSCPDAAELVARVERLLGGPLVGLDADASVEAPRSEGGEWRLELRLRWARGSDDRTLFAARCGALADATVVLVAVLAAPLAVVDDFVSPAPVSVPPLPPAPVLTPAPAIAPSGGEPAPSIGGEATASSRPGEPELELERAAPRVAPASRAGTRRRGAYARLVGVAGFGALPRADLGALLAVGGLLPRLRLEGALLLLPAQAATLADGRGAAQGLAAAGVRVCPRFLGPPVELSLCGGLEVGASWGRSIGLTPVRRAVGPWFAVTLGAALDWWFSPQVAVHAGVEGLAAPVTTDFALGDQVLAGGRHFGVRGLLGLNFAFAQQKSARPEK